MRGVAKTHRKGNGYKEGEPSVLYLQSTYHALSYPSQAGSWRHSHKDNFFHERHYGATDTIIETFFPMLEKHDSTSFEKDNCTSHFAYYLGSVCRQGKAET